MADAQPILLTGASGFVGAAVRRTLIARGQRVHALVNRTVLEPHPQVTSFPGGLFDEAALDRAAANCSSAIHLVGIIAEHPRQGVTFEKVHVEGTRRVIDALHRAGVRRMVHMSALGTRPDARSTYHQTKWQAEQLVRSSSLDWTILRPALIHGPAGEFTQMAIAWARKRKAPWLFMPYFGRGLLGTGGSGRVQPVYVEDVARAFVEALENPRTLGQTYDLAGPDPLTWPQMHRAFAEAVIGRPRLTAAIPAWYARLLTRVLPRWAIPFNRDQVLMAEEDNTADLRPFVADFGWCPRPFEPTLREYLARS